MIKLIIGAVVAVVLVVGAFMLLDPAINKNQVADTVEVADTFTYTIEGEVSITKTISVPREV